MFVFLFLLVLTGFSLYMGLKKGKTFFLLVPFIGIFGYFFVEVLMVPAPFIDTVKFIFSLR